MSDLIYRLKNHYGVNLQLEAVKEIERLTDEAAKANTSEAQAVQQCMLLNRTILEMGDEIDSKAAQIVELETLITDIGCLGEWCGKSPSKDSSGLCYVCEFARKQT